MLELLVLIRISPGGVGQSWFASSTGERHPDLGDHKLPGLRTRKPQPLLTRPTPPIQLRHRRQLPLRRQRLRPNMGDHHPANSSVPHAPGK